MPVALCVLYLEVVGKLGWEEEVTTQLLQEQGPTFIYLTVLHPLFVSPYYSLRTTLFISKIFVPCLLFSIMDPCLNVFR